MNNGGNPRKRVAHQGEVAVGSNTPALILSLVLPRMSGTLIHGSTLSCSPALLWGGFFNIFFIIITYISNVFTSIGNILSKIRLIRVQQPIVIILRLSIALNFIHTILHPHFLHIII